MVSVETSASKSQLYVLRSPSSQQWVHRRREVGNFFRSILQLLLEVLNTLRPETINKSTMVQTGETLNVLHQLQSLQSSALRVAFTEPSRRKARPRMMMHLWRPICGMIHERNVADTGTTQQSYAKRFPRELQSCLIHLSKSVCCSCCFRWGTFEMLRIAHLLFK